MTREIPLARSGVTLIEVAIAIVILSVAILAAGRLQDLSLKSTREARFARLATDLSRGEIEKMRVSFSDITTLCQNKTLNNFSITCTPTPCQLSSNNLSCTSGVSSPVAYKVAFSISRNSKQYLNFQTVVSP